MFSFYRTTTLKQGELDSGEKRRKWLGNNDRRIIIHFTPFHGSWLNMVEIWFRIMGRMCLKNSYTSPAQLHDAILEFAEIWSRELAHPFNWNYKGIGLHQKAVKRFTVMLKYSAGEMTLQLMSKESLLMVNLMNDYWSEVELKYWVELFDTISEFTEQLYENISKSSQPKVKKKAAEALALLLETIGLKMKNAKLVA